MIFCSNCGKPLKPPEELLPGQESIVQCVGCGAAYSSKLFTRDNAKKPKQLSIPVSNPFYPKGSW